MGANITNFHNFSSKDRTENFYNSSAKNKVLLDQAKRNIASISSKAEHFKRKLELARKKVALWAYFK